MSKGTDATVIGAIIGAVVGVAPRVYDKVTGKRHEDADTASLVSAGAGSVTAAALALLDQVQEERNSCQVQLAAANARIDAGLAELEQLRRQVETLQAFQQGP